MALHRFAAAAVAVDRRRVCERRLASLMNPPGVRTHISPASRLVGSPTNEKGKINWQRRQEKNSHAAAANTPVAAARVCQLNHKSKIAGFQTFIGRLMFFVQRASGANCLGN